MVSRYKLLAGMLLVTTPPAWADCADMLPNAAEARAPQRLLEASDLIELRDIGMPDPSYFFLPSPLAVSPDGRSIALVLSRGDLATNGYCRALVVIAARGAAAPRVVDRGGEMITAIDVKRGLFVNTGFPDLVVPAWSPDGRWIAYLKRIDGVTQLWRARADGGGSAAVTRSAVDVERWAWAPNGRDLLYASRPGIAEARAISEAEAGHRPTDPQISWHLARFIEKVRSVSLDPVLMRRDWLSAYDFASQRGAVFLGDYARSANPFGAIGQKTVSVQVTSVVRASDQSFQVKWIETAFDRGAQAGTSHWTGILTVKLKPPASAEVLRKNPLGLYVDAIDWSREIEPAANPAVSSRAAARPVQPAPEVSITAATDGAASASPIPANPENRQ